MQWFIIKLLIIVVASFTVGYYDYKRNHKNDKSRNN